MQNWGEGKVWAAGWSSSGRFDVNAVVGCAQQDKWGEVFEVGREACKGGVARDAELTLLVAYSTQF